MKDSWLINSIDGTFPIDSRVCVVLVEGWLFDGLAKVLIDADISSVSRDQCQYSISETRLHKEPCYGGTVEEDTYLAPRPHSTVRIEARILEAHQHACSEMNEMLRLLKSQLMITASASAMSKNHYQPY